MQDLTPAEIEALSRVMGDNFTPPDPHLREGSSKIDPPRAARGQLASLRENETAISPLSNQLYEVPIQLEVLLGSTKMTLGKILELRVGSLLPLDHFAGEPLEIRANGKTIAKGEITIVNNTNYGVRILDIVQESSS